MPSGQGHGNPATDIENIEASRETDIKYSTPNQSPKTVQVTAGARTILEMEWHTKV
jgi:hypothetical protein